MTIVHPVILCGGSGTRLWPLSRTSFPKQFINLSGSKSLFQNAVKRTLNIFSESTNAGKCIIVANKEHEFLVHDQLQSIGVHNYQLILEPMGKNTAPAVTMAALQSCEESENPILVVTPADQIIMEPNAFEDALEKALHCANEGSILTLGVVADHPATGYGYIKVSGDKGLNDAYGVEEFKEKPSFETAEAYLATGQYFWNSGIFILKANVWLEALNTFRADIFETCLSTWKEREEHKKVTNLSTKLFANIPSESIDYAVIEKCPGSQYEIKNIALNAGWSDLGAWDAVWKSNKKDVNGNVLVGDTLTTESSNCFIHASSRLVASVGLKDTVVVETPDVVLIADQSQAQAIKSIVNQLEKAERSEKDTPRKVLRPWGWYDSIEEGAGFKVKRILVRPGERLSLQKHTHRSEHWIVVRGIAEVTVDERKFSLQVNESTYIPAGSIHRLENQQDDDLEIIEVQCGSYLGEDDIVRLEDNYGRIIPG